LAGGKLCLVGSGITLGRQISQRTISEILGADVVFSMTDAFCHEWLSGIRADVIGLQQFYGKDKDRRATYREMDAAIMAEVRSGKRVCAVFYGHPGVFADVPHEVIRKAREEGFDAWMEPGISAEACLYADLGIDPGARGVQSFEATQFLVFDRVLDPTALLILWQVALAGDLSCTQFSADPRRLSVLRDKLLRWYPRDTEVILYEAAQLPVGEFRADRLKLSGLPEAAYQEYTTLVLPPVQQWGPDREALAGLGYTEADLP
jgi:siroheme synthase